ncbi:MAG: J domain-containing protein [Chloroflexi bacterium]|nr:J domain-containing protein [Chloroflexota bacterium]
MARSRNAETRRRAVPTPYKILGVSPYATADELRQAYHALAKQYHPDANPPEKRAWAETQMKRLNEAYTLLADPVRRANYDDAHPPPPPARPAPPIEPIDPAQIKIDLRDDPEMQRRATIFWSAIAFALALLAVGVYFGLVGGENAPQPLQAFGEFLTGQRVLHIGGLLTFTVGEFALMLTGIFIAMIPIAWLWLRR